MKKGFTLIELLAVIIIITIISMIGSNMVLGVIDKAKEQAFTRSVEAAMNAFDFVRQYNESGITTIEIKSSDLKLEHNRFIGGDIILDDNGNAKVLYATDGNYCASGLLGSLVVEKGNCNQDLVSPTVTIEATPSLDKATLTIRVNATDSGLGLDPKAYSFDNGTTWQESNEVSVSSSYKNIIKVRDIVNNITTIDYNISKLTINANGGVITGLDEVSVYWLEDGATKNIPTPIKVGYSFTDWTKVGDSSISGNTFTMGTIETSLTANYINATFTLQVNPNGGTWDGYITTQSYSKIYGSTTTINNPTRANYTFNGWSVSGTNSIVSGTTFTMGSANASLTANWIQNVTNFAYVGDVQSFIVPVTGLYQVELWGASGGSNTPGKGSYTSGDIFMTQGSTYYIYVGGVGNELVGGWNGGGNAYNSGQYSTGGGGATDVRLVNGTWNDSTGLNSRIMVAGGGGGGGNYDSSNLGYGGSGGGLISNNGTSSNGSWYPTYSGSGGTQTTAGYQIENNAYTAGFGFGGYGGNNMTCCGTSGGGGGYYGGGSSTRGHNGAGGGSSFISGYAGVNAITSSLSLTPTYNTAHYSGKYFVNSKIIAGINIGNGKAKITYIGSNAPSKINSGLNNVRYIKDCINGNNVDANNHWVELQAIYNGINVAKNKTITGTVVQNSSYPYTRITDGDINSNLYAQANANGLQCITVDLGSMYNLDEIAIWHYWADSRAYNNNVTSVSSDNTNWVIIINKYISETSNGKRVDAYNIVYNYPYTGSQSTFTANLSGYYRLEVWGAQGGGGSGKGGYSSGVVFLNANEILYVNVGGKGNIYSGMSGGTGGYNGGGNGGTSGYYTGGSGGGGATHIATMSGLLSSLSSKQSFILIVAGGGGGDGAGAGYSGGGLSGISDAVCPGTQTSGYAFGQGQNGRDQGGSNCNGEGAGGGGGGYYGGCAVTVAATCSYGGSGGSGFIGGAPLSYRKSTAITIDGLGTFVNSEGSFGETGHVGNGYATITYLGT